MHIWTHPILFHTKDIFRTPTQLLQKVKTFSIFIYNILMNKLKIQPNHNLQQQYPTVKS